MSCERCALPQHGRRERMPQQMRGTSTGAHHASATKCPVDDTRDGIMRGEGAKWCTAADKQRIGIGPRPAFLQVGHDRLTHFLGQRQSRVAAALTANLNRCALPVDVTQAEMHDIARPKTQTGQQQQDRPIPPAHG